MATHIREHCGEFTNNLKVFEQCLIIWILDTQNPYLLCEFPLVAVNEAALTNQGEIISLMLRGFYYLQGRKSRHCYQICTLIKHLPINQLIFPMTFCSQPRCCLVWINVPKRKWINGVFFFTNAYLQLLKTNIQKGFRCLEHDQDNCNIKLTQYSSSSVASRTVKQSKSFSCLQLPSLFELSILLKRIFLDLGASVGWGFEGNWGFLEPICFLQSKKRMKLETFTLTEIKPCTPSIKGTYQSYALIMSWTNYEINLNYKDCYLCLFTWTWK